MPSCNITHKRYPFSVWPQSGVTEDKYPLSVACTQAHGPIWQSTSCAERANCRMEIRLRDSEFAGKVWCCHVKTARRSKTTRKHSTEVFSFCIN
ncbi:unnamed protein product [Amoebophrya sp. A25]|nr:unnamed protein product [Amoebophrya sp. A25]|eukprot:GSA25T00003341001.1